MPNIIDNIAQLRLVLDEKADLGVQPEASPHRARARTHNPRDGDIEQFLTQLKPAITERVFEIAQRQHDQRVLAWLYDSYHQYNRLWQDGKYNYHLYTERLIWQKINYIHTNAISRKIVRTAAEYPYSSYRAMYEIDDEIIIPIDRDFWWEEYVYENNEIKYPSPGNRPGSRPVPNSD